MKLIIFHPHKSISYKQGYSSSIRIGYILNIHVVSAGISELEHRLLEDTSGFSFDQKLQYLLKAYEPGKDLDAVKSVIKLFKDSNSKRNKGSKEIVILAQLKKHYLEFFDFAMTFRNDTYNQLYYICQMKDLIEPSRFSFLNMPADVGPLSAKEVVSPVELLQLLLPNSDSESPVFFIDSHLGSGDLGLKFVLPHNEGAEDLDLIYANYGFIFPKLQQLTTNEIRTARTHMEEPCRELREKLSEWARICHQDPASDNGLIFFKENINDLLSSLKNIVFESTVLKNASRITREKSQLQIVIGQMPIELIWECYYKNESITQEQYDELLRIKTEQHPKYEGRWPVFFHTVLADDLNSKSPEEQDLPYSRKTIAVD